MSAGLRVNLTSCLFSSCPALQRDRLDAHAMFERVSEQELEKDPAANLLCEVGLEIESPAPKVLPSSSFVYNYDSCDCALDSKSNIQLNSSQPI